MTFTRYDTNGVYELQLSTGKRQTIVVTDRQTTSDSVRGYAAEIMETRLGNKALHIDGRPIGILADHIIARRFEGGFMNFDKYHLPEDSHLIDEVPEDAEVITHQPEINL